MKKILLLVCVVALLATMAVGANATTSNWLITLKALNTGFAAGGASVTFGVGTPSTANAAWPTTAGSTAQGEKSTGDAVYHSKHIYAVDAVAPIEYNWDFKVGARSDANYDTINICIYNNIASSLGADQQIDAALGYAFFDGSVLARWFSAAGTKTDYATQKGFDVDKWSDMSALLQAKGWTPDPTSNGWFYQDTVIKGTTLDDLASYRFEAFGPGGPPPQTPEPGSIVALGSGLIGLAGFAIRRRKA